MCVPYESYNIINIPTLLLPISLIADTIFPLRYELNVTRIPFPSEALHKT